jgi:hypothetical protein
MYLITEDWYDRIPLLQNTVPNVSALINLNFNYGPNACFEYFLYRDSLKEKV